MDLTTLFLSIILAFVLFVVLMTRDIAASIGAVVCSFIVGVIRVANPDYLKQKNSSEVKSMRRLTLYVLITFYLFILVAVHQILTLLNKI